ncbi:MAG: metallophosphoesterase family protein [Cytophagales bacterium]|nr:metallophosphoesterase family protein [Cytophagales bacterium]
MGSHHQSSLHPKRLWRSKIIALLSDIHGNLAALEAVVADCKDRGVDVIVNLGDCLSGPLLPSQTADYLMAQNWLTLAGNHERQLLNLSTDRMGLSDAYTQQQLSPAHWQWLRTLPPNATLSPDVFVCHGTPTSDLQYYLETVDVQASNGIRAATLTEILARTGGQISPVIACGHSHIPRQLRTNFEQLIVNPGSVGLPAYSDVQPHPHAIENGSPDARYALLHQDAKGWHAELVSIAYDFEPMANLAESNGRPDWALALRTGGMKSSNIF